MPNRIFPITLTPRAKRGLAAVAVALSLGGLVLYRASATDKPVSPIPVGKNSVNFVAPPVSGSLSFSHGTVFASSGQSLYAELRLATTGDETRRAPLAIALVLDTSGSMQGEKLEQAKRSMLRLLDGMNDSDQVALVRYSDHAEVIESLAPLGQLRQRLAAGIRSLDANGGTNIPAGLQEGLQTLHFAPADTVRRLVLVSDGLDSSRDRAENIARSAGRDGLTVSSLGIGLDFDEAYLASLARVGHGNFGFVRSADSLSAFLHRELQQTASTKVQNVAVSLQLPAGLRFVRALGGQTDTSSHNGQLTISSGALFAGEQKRIVLEFATDAMKDGQPLTVSGQAVITGLRADTNTVALDAFTLMGSADQNKVVASLDYGVQARCMSALASWRSLMASEAYARGDGAEADRLLEQNIAELKAAQGNAPAAEAAAIDSQIDTYRQNRGVFSSQPPASTAGRAAAKKAYARDSANLAHESY